MKMPPQKKTILAPQEGWAERAYYIVEASFSKRNPIHRYIFYTGFLSVASEYTTEGKPAGYNQFFMRSCEYVSIYDAYYLKPLTLFGYDDVHEGATCLPETIKELELKLP